MMAWLAARSQRVMLALIAVYAQQPLAAYMPHVLTQCVLPVQ